MKARDGFLYCHVISDPDELKVAQQHCLSRFKLDLPDVQADTFEQCRTMQ